MRKNLFLLLIIVSIANYICAQNRTLRGQVVNENFEPISNAVIRFGNSLETVECDDLGVFEISIDQNEEEIEAIYIGYKTERVFIKKKCYVNIVMINYNSLEFETINGERSFYKTQKRRILRLYKKAVESGRLKKDENCT